MRPSLEEIDVAIDDLSYVADQRYINDDDEKKLRHALKVLRAHLAGKSRGQNDE